MFTRFLKKADGTLIIEHALIIAMISIGLILAIQPSTIAASFGNFIGAFSACLTTGSCV